MLPPLAACAEEPVFFKHIPYGIAFEAFNTELHKYGMVAEDTPAHGAEGITSTALLEPLPFSWLGLTSDLVSFNFYEGKLTQAAIVCFGGVAQDNLHTYLSEGLDTYFDLITRATNMYGALQAASTSTDLGEESLAYPMENGLRDKEKMIAALESVKNGGLIFSDHFNGVEAFFHFNHYVLEDGRDQYGYMYGLSFHQDEGT